MKYTVHLHNTNNWWLSRIQIYFAKNTKWEGIFVIVMMLIVVLLKLFDSRQVKAIELVYCASSKQFLYVSISVSWNKVPVKWLESCDLILVYKFHPLQNNPSPAISFRYTLLYCIYVHISRSRVQKRLEILNIKNKNYVKFFHLVMVRFAVSAMRGATAKGSFHHVTAQARWAQCTRAAWRSGCPPPTPATVSFVTLSSPSSAGQGPSQR